MKTLSIIGVLCWLSLLTEYDFTLLICWFLAITALSAWVYLFMAKKDREKQTAYIKRLEGMLSRLAAELDGNPQLAEEPEPDNEREDKNAKLFVAVTAAVLSLVFIAAVIFSYASEIWNALNHLR